MIVGGIISLVAAITGLSAQNMPTMVAAAAIAGLGSGSQQLAYVSAISDTLDTTLADAIDSLAATSELVPNRLRGTVQACLDLLIFPWSVFGALTGKNDLLPCTRLAYNLVRRCYGRVPWKIRLSDKLHYWCCTKQHKCLICLVLVPSCKLSWS
jgi:hypothetical protein